MQYRRVAETNLINTESFSLETLQGIKASHPTRPNRAVLVPRWIAAHMAACQKNEIFPVGTAKALVAAPGEAECCDNQVSAGSLSRFGPSFDHSRRDA